MIANSTYPTYETLSDTRWESIEKIKQEVGWNHTGQAARKWWNAFESENIERPALVEKLLTEIHGRQGSIQEFFMAYVYSGADNIQANLDFLDFVRQRAMHTPPAVEDFKTASVVFYS